MAELSLSTEVVNNVIKVLQEHDSSASDQMVASQYLAAVIGFIVSKENFNDEQRNEVINELSSFIRYVSDDLRGNVEKSPQAQTQEAFGVWKPE
ncbi:MAG: hypothetical protein P8L38_03275 [Gammaproteobacteria bacterium]|jgi:hypothetical protein|nr:hypothetical protein [Gammaproteobacteria bacterium]|tara:strand:+ start:727 stop:1008 length:282 start_codon:yes stop_codon:yes gene_type:complete